MMSIVNGKRWEANWSEHHRERDEEELARRLQQLDKKLGEGNAYNKIQAELEAQREREAEQW